jgi:hypothetical protein
VIAGLRWRTRRWFWDHLATFKYDRTKPTPVPVPSSDETVALVPLGSAYPKIPITRALVADRIPGDEQQRLKSVFARVQVALYRIVPPQQRGLPPVDAEPQRALAAAYTPAHRRRYALPERPAALDEADLGMLAVASPFACYVAGNGDGTFGWDLRVLDEVDCHQGLRSLGSVVTFEVDRSGGSLHAVRIDCDAGSCTPSDPDWPLARRLALSAASTHLSVVRHFGWIHLAGGGPLAVLTRAHLPHDHPVRRLVWPHVYSTQYSNDLITVDQLSRGGDFEGIFSCTHEGVLALLDATVGDFDLGTVDPDVDEATRGLEGVASPSIENRREHHRVFVAHARRYLERCYDDNDRIAADPAVQAWFEALSSQVRGVDRVAGGTATLDGVARLVAAIIQLAAVEHEIAGSGLWDYQLWSDAIPARVPADGSGVPLDVYQRLVNANFNLNVHRTPLLTDFSPLALDANGAEAFRLFRADLVALQTSLDAGAAASWRMEPKRLKANINA